MRSRIWEDAAAMGIVSVLGFLLNDDGEVVGGERTQVLCRLMPSIHTPTHRAILAMLVAGLSDADAQIFYAEKGLKVLNAWLQDGLGRKKESGTSREKRRVEMFSQVRALLRILDVSVQTDAARKQNSYLASTIAKALELLDNAGNDFAAEWSKLNIYRRHFESSCGVISTAKDTRGEPAAKRPRASSATNGSSASTGASSSASRLSSAGSLPRTSSFTSSTVAATPSTSSTPVRSSVMTSSRPAGASAAAALLQYQPKSFLQVDNNASKADDELDEFVEDDDEDMLAGVEVITNVGQPVINASLDTKIRNHGHAMQYAERTPCRSCHRMTAKRCDYCSVCVKCAQRDRCQPPPAPPGSASASANGVSSAAATTNSTAGDAIGHGPISSARSGSVMSAEERTKQVLGSAMDQAIYKAFRCEDFYSAFSLITNGMDVNFQRVESDYSTVLMAAAHHGRDDATTKLLDLGANPCIADKEGNLAWAFAERRGHKELMERLKKCADEWAEKHPETQGSAPASS